MTGDLGTIAGPGLASIMADFEVLVSRAHCQIAVLMGTMQQLEHAQEQIEQYAANARAALMSPSGGS